MNFKQIDGRGTCEGYAVVKTAEIKKTTKGADYLDMTLADNSGEINAKLWEYNGENIQPFDFVKVRGSISSYNGVEQLRVDKIRKVTDADDVDIGDYVPSACAPGQLMYDEILAIVNQFTDTELMKLVTFILNNEKEKLLYWPAAKSNHHAVRGGLLMHTLSMLRLADTACSIYAFVNKDLLFSGVILHDIAKLEELSVAPIGIAGEYTTKGNLLGHLVAGAMYVDRTGRELGISEDKLLLLEHMLISHHGQPEWGAAKVPMTVEAELLSQLDVLDARMNEYSAAIASTEENTFSAPQKALGGKSVYNHGCEENITCLV